MNRSRDSRRDSRYSPRPGTKTCASTARSPACIAEITPPTMARTSTTAAAKYAHREPWTSFHPSTRHTAPNSSNPTASNAPDRSDEETPVTPMIRYSAPATPRTMPTARTDVGTGSGAPALPGLFVTPPSCEVLGSESLRQHLGHRPHTLGRPYFQRCSTVFGQQLSTPATRHDQRPASVDAHERHQPATATGDQ